MAATETAPPLTLSPASAGMLLTPAEFDAADFEPGWRYELINQVLVATPSASRAEKDPNQYLTHWLLGYKERHPQGAALDLVMAEETVSTNENRRRADNTIWAGLGRLPTEDDPPTILVEFVSRGRRNRRRDYETRRAEYGSIGAKEYWIIDRFQRTMTVVLFSEGKSRDIPVATERVLPETETYRTPLLPGFELPLPKLFAVCDRWTDHDE